MSIFKLLNYSVFKRRNHIHRPNCYDLYPLKVETNGWVTAFPKEGKDRAATLATVSILNVILLKQPFA